MSLYPQTSGYDTPKLYAEEVRDILLEEVVTNPDFSNIHTIVDDIVVNREVPRLYRGGLMMGDGPTCNPTSDTYEITSSPFTWTPVSVGYFYDVCQTDFPKFWELLKAPGLNKEDLTQSKFWNMFIDFIVENHVQEVYRKAWFDDQDIATIASGGTLANAYSPSKFNQINGFWKQIFAQGVANSEQRVTIAANTATGQDLTGTAANDIMEELVKKAPLNMANNMILVTDSIFRAHLAYLRAQGMDASFVRKFQADAEYDFAGYRVIPVKNWDKTIKTYFYNSGTGLYDKPHRAVMTSAENLLVGTEVSNNLFEYDQWFSKDDQVVKIKAKFNFDAKIAFPTDMAFAY